MRITLLLFLLTGASAVASPEYCSLVVRVHNAGGVALSGIQIVVSELSGVVTVGNTTENGEAQFCGLGVLGATIKVGRSTCNQVLVQNVPLAWDSTREVNVTYVTCPIESPTVIPPCSVVFRFRDENEKWISNVSFTPPVPRAPTLVSDSFGRVMVRMETGEELHLMTLHAGYASEKLDLLCDNALIGQERLVTLRKSP
jgi:hypothetical protein